MIALPEDRKIDALLARVFGGRPPQADFSRWRGQHPDAVAMLLSRAATARETGAARVSAGEPRTWLAGRRLRFALLSAAALAAALALVWAGWLYYAGGRAGAIAQKQESDEMPPSAQDARAEATREILTERVRIPARTALERFPPDWIRVAESSAIVRVMATAETENTLTCRPIRVIYGRVADGVLAVECPRNVRQDFKAEREVIIYLAQYRRSDGTTGLREHGMAFDVPAMHSLDKREQEIVEVIETGSFLLLPSISPEDLAPSIERSEIILRAKLTKIGEESTEWKVTGEVFQLTRPGDERGRQPETNQRLEERRHFSPPLAVASAPWRLRAESIVRHRAVQEANRSFTPEEVQEEFSRLVHAELKVGREAILLLRSPEQGKEKTAYQQGKEKTAYEAVGILRDDPAHPKHLDEVMGVIGDINLRLLDKQ